MDKSLEILQKANWFLQPISDLVLYFFTTSSGITLLIILLVLYIIISLVYSYYSSFLLHQAASSNYERGRIPNAEKVYIFLKEIGKALGNLATKLPMLLAIFIFLFAIVGFSAGIRSMNTFIENEKRIDELQKVVKHLNQRYKVAEVEVVNQAYEPNGITIQSTLKITYFDYADLGINPEPQLVTIKGNDIYFDAIVMNFEYSAIAEGNVKNITIPYRLFSNEIPQSNGIELNIKNESGIPYLFIRKPEELYGISQDRYNQRLNEIVEYMNDEKKARDAGIRTVYGNAVHQQVWKGTKLIIWVEQTGGLVIKQAGAF